VKAAQKLMDYIELVPSNPSELTMYELECEGGSMTVYGILNNDVMSIAQTVISNEGITTKCHTHKSLEIVILVEGSPIHIGIAGDRVRKVDFNHPVHIQPNVAHSLVKTEGRAKILAILVPGSTDWPKGVIQ
jgi:hypothetical protein